MDKKRLIIFSDYGLDDACALAFLLGCAERFGGIDIVCVAGNAPARQSLINAQKLLNNYEGSIQNVRLICSDDVAQEHASLPSIHGADGMGDLFPPPAKIDAVPYAEWLKNAPPAPVVLSLGPCTAVYKALDALKPSELILMAGMVNAVPNFRGMEFNQALDPGSFNALVTKPHVIATLDTCRVPQFNLADFRLNGGKLLHKLVNRAAELAEARHPDNCYIYDLITALYLCDPGLFTVREVTDPWGSRLQELSVKEPDFSLGEYLKSL